jgi:hypothetical protein
MKKFCTACGTVGYPVLVKKGSTGTAFLLWIIFLLPGIIYSIWRANSEREICPACGSPQVIPVDSPMAQKLMGDDYRKMKEADARQQEIQLAAQAESLRLAKQAEAERLAQPWLKRNSANLTIAGIAVVVFVGLIALTLWASYQVPETTVRPAVSTETPTQSPTLVVKKQKPVHKTQLKKNEALSWQDQHSQVSCENDGFIWRDNGCHAYTEPAKPQTSEEPKSSAMRDAEAGSFKTQNACEAAGYYWDALHDKCLSNN